MEGWDGGVTEEWWGSLTDNLVLGDRGWNPRPTREQIEMGERLRKSPSLLRTGALAEFLGLRCSG